MAQAVARLRAEVASRHANLIRVLLARRRLTDDEARALPPVQTKDVPETCVASIVEPVASDPPILADRSAALSR